MTQVEVNQEERVPCYSLFLLYSGIQLIGCGPPTLGRPACFTQSTDSNVNLTQKCPHRCIHNNVWPNAWAPYVSFKLQIKLTTIDVKWLRVLFKYLPVFWFLNWCYPERGYDQTVYWHFSLVNFCFKYFEVWSSGTKIFMTRYTYYFFLKD
jgi:hypothetical protein